MGTIGKTAQARNPENDDRPFDPYRLAVSQSARELVASLTKWIEHAEEHVGARKRRRKAKDQASFEGIVAAVLCDAMHRELTSAGGWITIPFSKQILGQAGRYSSPVLTKTLPDIVKRLAGGMVDALELSEGTRGYFGRGTRTRVRCGWNLRSEMQKYAISLADLGLGRPSETIILKSLKAGKVEAKWIDYDDSEVTRGYRRDLDRINQWIADADLTCFAVGPSGVEIDEGDRLLRRYFNGSFDSGGRLFGGFWQSLKKKQRQDDLLIDGESVVVLDYGQMGARIAYGMAGAAVPEGDLYRVSGLEPYRDAVKQVFNALLFDETERRRLPMGTRKGIPDHITYRQVQQAIASKHHAIQHLFGTGIGLKTLFIESQVLVAVLLRLIDLNIVALPIHDAIIVAKQHADQARKVMQETFESIVGVAGPVSEQGSMRVASPRSLVAEAA